MRSLISTTTLAALGGMLLATFGISVVAFGDAGVDPTRLPLGDGKVTTSGPKKGYVYVCHTSNAPAGAFRDGPWIKSDGTFDLTAKAVVDGSVAWPGHVTFAKSGSALRVSGNGLPVTGTTTGVFPIASTDDAYQYDRNPNTIGASTVSYTLPASPKLASRPTCLSGGPIGIAKNGVAIFDALDANDRDAVAHETQDACGGHPQQSGVYHYHSIPSCLTDGEATNKPSGLVGYALDGIPIYGPRGEGGKLVSNDDLDACHGRTSWVSLNGKRVRIYHYQATLEYPYTLGCYRGTAASAVGGGPR
jgi:YHYH protein